MGNALIAHAFFYLSITNLTCIGVTSRHLKAVNLALAHSAEEAVLKSAVPSLERCEQLLYVLALGFLVLGAKARYNRCVSLVRKIYNVLFLRIYERSYERYLSV